MESGVINGFNKLGISTSEFRHELTDYDTDSNYMRALSDFLMTHSSINAVFSVNYVPIIAMVCKAHHIPYISWIVDCPCLTLYSNTLSYPTNYVFLFDRLQVERFSSINPGHIFHLPLAFDPTVYSNYQHSQEEDKAYSCNISFVGSLYTQNNQYDEIYESLPARIRGYADGIVASQLNLFGCNLIPDSISDEWAKEFTHHAGFKILSNYNPCYREFISDYFLGYKCTQLERTTIMKSITIFDNTRLYTTSDTSSYPEINNCGIADSLTVMPKVFASSKINLNITLKTISSGIPLRCFDIMGMGGFLISNYQPELAEYFVDGEECVMYYTIPDLLSKIEYYLSHESARIRIAKQGQQKVLSQFSFEHQLTQMFRMLQ